MRPSTKLFTLLAILSVSAIAEANVPNIDQMSLVQMREALDRGSITSEQIVEHYLAKINADNRKGKGINAVITLNPDAVAEAKQWDDLNPDQKRAKQGPLAGIPFLVKDNFDTKGLATTGGSFVLRTSIPEDNAHLVKMLVENGAIVLGKTNMSELAASYGWLGYSSFGGQTLNPWNTKRDASGSSSGSAAAVAAKFAPFALGSDTSGSIRAPASVTGTVGFRPSLGLLSRTGIIPLSLTFDTGGVITQSVEDQAIVLDVIKGKDDRDAATLNMLSDEISFQKTLKVDALKGKTIGVISNFRGGNSEVDKVFDAAIRTLEKKGAKVVTVKLPREFETLWSDVLGPVGESEFKPQFERYLATLSASQPKSLSRFVELAKENQARGGDHLMNPARLSGLEKILESSDVDSPKYISILSRRIPDLRHSLSTVMSERGIDSLFFATINCPASIVHGQTDESYSCKSNDTYASSYIASATGFPEVSVPAGSVSGNLPVGVSFLGQYGQDAQTLNFGYSFLGK